MLRVKICGNRNVDEIACAASCGADAVGLIVGVRHQSEDALEVDAAAVLLRHVPVFVSSVLVTHLVTAEQVLRLHAAVPTSVIQLHDAIAIEEVEVIRRAIPQVRLIKAVGVVDARSIEIARQFEPYVDAILLDTHTNGRIGGTGVVHDWSISRRIVDAVSKPVILAGGLRAENVMQAVEAVRPYGVDVNTGVEFPNGDKDPQRVRAFIALAKCSGMPTGAIKL